VTLQQQWIQLLCQLDQLHKLLQLHRVPLQEQSLLQANQQTKLVEHCKSCLALLLQFKPP
jgi:hypothetical protein